MKKLIKKITSIFIITAMLITVVSFSSTAQANEYGKVRVIVRNDTFSKENGAKWDGLLLDEWIGINQYSTVMTVFIEAIENKGLTQSGAESGNINEICGVATGDNGYMSGWMGTINDWFTNQGLNTYTVDNGGLNNGDEICILYTSDWGADLGSSWYNNDTYLNDLTITNGELSTEFSSFEYEYTLFINAPQKDIYISPEAANKNFQVRIYKNEYTPSTEYTYYKNNNRIEVADGDTVYIGVGDPLWPTMGYSEKATVYTIKIKNINNDIFSKLEDTSKHLLSLDIPSPASIGGEWMILGLARNEVISESFINGYYNKAVDYISKIGSSKLDRAKSSENSRIIIALTSINKDVKNICGYNLLEPLADFDFVKKQGINGPIWALIALDTINYEASDYGLEKDITTREKLVDYILQKQLEEGGWDNKNIAFDVDTTSMAIQALSPYYCKNIEVRAAVDKAIELLSLNQNDNGGFSSSGEACCESCAQVLVALTSIGINPNTDPRFIKNKNTLTDAIMSFSTKNGFAHSIFNNTKEYDQMATEQAYYALTAYSRFLQGKTSLFNMSDLFIENHLFGDVNGDGKINILDVTEIQKYIAELISLNEQQKFDADFDKNGKISILDATAIQLYIAYK